MTYTERQKKRLGAKWRNLLTTEKTEAQKLSEPIDQDTEQMKDELNKPWADKWKKKAPAKGAPPRSTRG